MQELKSLHNNKRVTVKTYKSENKNKLKNKKGDGAVLLLTIAVLPGQYFVNSALQKGCGGVSCNFSSCQLCGFGPTGERQSVSGCREARKRIGISAVGGRC